MQILLYAFVALIGYLSVGLVTVHFAKKEASMLVGPARPDSPDAVVALPSNSRKDITPYTRDYVHQIN